MSATRNCVASLARLSLVSAATRPMAVSAIPSIPKFLAPAAVTQQTRGRQGMTMAEAARRREKEKLKKKKRNKKHKEYKHAAPSMEERYSICDAMRYLRASEVGNPPSQTLYELSIKLRTVKNAPVIRNRIRFPYPVKNDTRIAVICKEDSPVALDARNNGAVIVGEESLYQLIRDNQHKLPFNRLICHTDCEASLKKAGLGRILGPKGLMPSLKTNTLVKSIRSTMMNMVGREQYRERVGVIRLAVGNIQFNPKMLADNVKTLVDNIQGDVVRMEDRCKKQIIEVVLSTTQGPGFPLSGGFLSADESVVPEQLTSSM